jgi:hypothetical protein
MSARSAPTLSSQQIINDCGPQFDMRGRSKLRPRDQVAIVLAAAFVIGFPLLPRPYKDYVGTIAAVVVLAGLLWTCWLRAKKKMSR